MLDNFSNEIENEWLMVKAKYYMCASCYEQIDESKSKKCKRCSSINPEEESSFFSEPLEVQIYVHFQESDDDSDDDSCLACKKSLEPSSFNKIIMCEKAIGVEEEFSFD